VDAVPFKTNSFLTGATLPMDGGRTILGREPQP